MSKKYIDNIKDLIKQETLLMRAEIAAAAKQLRDDVFCMEN